MNHILSHNLWVGNCKSSVAPSAKIEVSSICKHVEYESKSVVTVELRGVHAGKDDVALDSWQELVFRI